MRVKFNIPFGEPISRVFLLTASRKRSWRLKSWMLCIVYAASSFPTFVLFLAQKGYSCDNYSLICNGNFQFGEVDTNLHVQTRYVQICAASLMQRDTVTPLIKEVALYCSFAPASFTRVEVYCKWKYAEAICFNFPDQYCLLSILFASKNIWSLRWSLWW